MAAQYSVYETKAKLSEILRLVKSDREVTITERGVPIAKIVPYVAAAEATLEDRLAVLAKDGQIREAKVRPAELKIVERKSAGALERFLEDRS
jgi:prevent-host-death family protein